MRDYTIFVGYACRGKGAVETRGRVWNCVLWKVGATGTLVEMGDEAGATEVDEVVGRAETLCGDGRWIGRLLMGRIGT